MCGIFGFSIPRESDVSPEQRVLLSAILGQENDNRGGDSFGVYVVNGTIGLYKGLGKSASQFQWSKLTGAAHVLMGHTRKSTVGATTIDNAHPFVIGNVIGAHNGYISNHSEMNAKYNRKFEVDSMHIFAHIQKGWALDELKGYGAIEYTNRKRSPEKVHLCRFYSGELHAMQLGEKSGVVWSSSERHLEYALAVAGLKASMTYKLEADQVYFAEKGCLYEKTGKKLHLGSTVYYSSGEDYCGTSYNSTHGAGFKNWKDDKDKKKEEKPVRRLPSVEDLKEPFILVEKSGYDMYFNTEEVRKFLGRGCTIDMNGKAVNDEPKDGNPEFAAVTDFKPEAEQASDASKAIVEQIQTESEETPSLLQLMGR